MCRRKIRANMLGLRGSHQHFSVYGEFLLCQPELLAQLHNGFPEFFLQCHFVLQ